MDASEANTGLATEGSFRVLRKMLILETRISGNTGGAHLYVLRRPDAFGETTLRRRLSASALTAYSVHLHHQPNQCRATD